MKTKLASRQGRYIRGVVSVLIVGVLATGLLGCSPAPQHGLAMSSSEGGEVITPGEGSFGYGKGTVISLAASPENGFRFVGWIGDVETVADVTSASTTVTMDGDYSITASFIAQYLLTIDSTAGGSVMAPGEGTFTYDAGTLVDLIAEAGEGYQFFEWTGDVPTIADTDAASTMITMNNNYSIIASFVGITPVVEIWSWHELHAIRNNLGGHYLLMRDLDSTSPDYQELVSPTADEGEGWQPIGTLDNPFNGSFDGQGHRISGLFIKRAGEDYVGLFGCFGGGGIIENLELANVAVTGGSFVGSLVGRNNYGTIMNSCSAGDVIGDLSVGGLVGLNAEQGIVRNSYASGSVTGQREVGGLVGNTAFSGIINSYSISSVVGEWAVGGLVGVNWFGEVSNSYSAGSVVGDSFIGGLVGYNYGGTSSRSFWDVEASCVDWSAGGEGKTTAEMKSMATFTRTQWNIAAVGAGTVKSAYIWNIIDGQTYPFLSWQSVG